MWGESIQKVLYQNVNELGIRSIPRNIRWKIEADLDEGVQMLADYYNKTVVVSIQGVDDYRLPKNAIKQYVHGGSGPYETHDYKRAAPQNKVFVPSSFDSAPDPSDENGIRIPESKVKLTVLPKNDHYIHSAERRKTVAHNYCPTCMLHASTAITVGAGKKSADKTKGRQKRRRNNLGLDKFSSLKASNY